ncbi:MAG TPA: hypothetical protein VIW45_02525, partial [Vicinamibacterales bacterium]
MRSRTARLFVVIVIAIAFVAVAALLAPSERQLQTIAASASAFDVHAREACDALADVRAAEQAYLVPGQGLPFWMHKVATTVDVAKNVTASLRQSARDATALSALMEADATLTEFEAVDRRAREYMNAGQQLMASDVIFTEGAKAAIAASHQIEAARVAEREATDAASADIRRREAYVAAGAAVFTLLVTLLLVPVPRPRESAS